MYIETLRLYPTLPYLDRMCEVDNYSIEPYHKYKIPKGMPVLIPIFAIQRDPKVFYLNNIIFEVMYF